MVCGSLFFSYLLKIELYETDYYFNQHGTSHNPLQAKTCCGSLPQRCSFRYAIKRAVEEGFASFLLVGDARLLHSYTELSIYSDNDEIIDIPDSDEAAREAVRLVRSGKADILMKELINTDNLLRAILDKEHGLLPAGKVLTHLAVMQILLTINCWFFSDAAVIPRPTLQQRIEMIWYAIRTLSSFWD